MEANNKDDQEKLESLYENIQQVQSVTIPNFAYEPVTATVGGDIWFKDGVEQVGVVLEIFTRNSKTFVKVKREDGSIYITALCNCWN